MSKNPLLRVKSVFEGIPEHGFRPISEASSPFSARSSLSRPLSRFSGSPTSASAMGGAGSLSESPKSESPKSTEGIVEWKRIYNNKPGECKWPLPPPSTDAKDCAFAFKDHMPIADNISISTLPAGTALFHATTIYPKQSEWFSGMRSFNSLPSSVMWFASSAEHAKHLNYTHILKFETKKDIKIIFIQNLFTQFGVLTGKDLLRHPRFQDLLRSSAATAGEPIVGYAGCNECEIAIFKEHLLDTFTLSPASPALIEKRNIGYITGGGKRRRTRRFRRSRNTRRSRN